MDELIDRAMATALTRSAVSELAATAAAAELREAIVPALRSRGPHAATVLAFALAASDEPIPNSVLCELLSDLPDISHFAPLVGASEGDRVTLLLDIVEGSRSSHERDALALYLATQLLEQQPPPPRLVARLRILTREPLGEGATALVLLAARTIDDPGLTTLTEEHLHLALDPGWTGFAATLSAPMFAPALEALPEREAPRVVAGYTLVRPGPKVGRNDPCPCGSGRKYKKCCEAKESAAGSEPLVEQFDALDERHSRVRQQLFGLLRPADLARVDAKRLTTLQLIQGMRKLLQYRRWEVAAAFMEHIQSRPDVPCGSEYAHEYHDEIADAALAAGDLAVAERHFELARPDEVRRQAFQLRLALARRSPEALALLEAWILRCLHDDNSSGIIDCANHLLDTSPALGIVMARGCISAERAFDAKLLLDEIERVRDRLGLSPNEPWWDVYDRLLGVGEPPIEPRLHAAARDERERLTGEVEQLRKQLDTAARDKRRLDDELQKRVHELHELTTEREHLLEQHARVPQPHDDQRASELTAERQRLRTKIEELKGEIAAGALQRADLRRELARLSSAPLPAARPAQSSGEDSGAQPEPAETADPAVTVPRSVLIPSYSSTAAKALAELPRQTAAHALHAIAALAAGEVRAWQGSKRMRATAEVCSTRVGRDYRVLFRVRQSDLEVLDVVHRKDLDAAIGRIAR